MGKSRLIGLLMYDLDTRVAISKLDAIDGEAWKHGYRSLIRNAGGHEDMIPQLVQEYAGGAVEGLIIVQPTAEMNLRTLEPLIYGNIPIVTLEPIEGVAVDCVTVDRKHGAYIAIRHLVELGHRRIGMLHGYHSDMHVAPRIEGYRKALTEYSIPFDESLLMETGNGYEEGFRAAVDLLSRDLGITAIFCNDDEAAIGAMKAVRDRGLEVPGDIAMIGFDNIEAGAYAATPLTSVAQPVSEVATCAVELLFERIANPGSGEPQKLISLKPRLVIRESCGGSSLKWTRH
jgi:DNA-binding LacI/PurR family transcriptional regulator